MPTVRTAKHLLLESTTKSVESGTYDVICQFCTVKGMVVESEVLKAPCCALSKLSLPMHSNVTYIGEIDKSYLPHVSTFIDRHEPFKESLFDETYKKLSPATWKSGSKLGFDKNFADFSSALVESITSSAGLERQFSTVGMHYGKLRNNLDAQKAGKMAFLYRQLNSGRMYCFIL